ncbi:peptidyl-tRNA hydrolase [mine drainage metagenome]|uniref:peptidyl-tRNA hydrolase n=1 Tax=mine drainage metagenome TaxID=410659 RepID=A0A1J5SHS9_9ZZZZ
MWLLVGLGNPGGSYARNRHNIGFMAADEIVRRHCFSPWRAKFHGQLAEGAVKGEKCLILKPDTYMNLSGQAVAAAARFHKIGNDHVLVLHDELDLPPGKVRVKTGGGAGGHNGLKSIDAHLGNDYRRVRLGIGHPGDKTLVTPWVLGDFAKADQDWLLPLLDGVAEHLSLLLEGNDTGFMTRLAQAVPAAKPKKPES